MDDTALSIVIRLKDEASAALTGLQGKVEDVSKSIGPAADVSKKFALALAGVGAAAIAFGVVTVKAAMESEKQMASFNATMKTIPGVTQASTDAILARAKAMEKMGFDDDEAANVLAKLYQRTGDVTQAMKLASLAADLSRAKNISLSDSAHMIELVMSGGGRALKEYGIEISNSLTPMQALGVLQEKVAGQADAFNKTLAGQATDLKVAWDDFEKTVGKTLLPLLTQLLTAVTPIVEKLMVWAENLKNLNQFLQEHQTLLIIIAGAIAGALMPAMIELAITIITTVIPAFLAAAVAIAPWIIGGAIIGGIVAGILWIIQNWQLVKAKFLEIWNGIEGFFISIWDAMQTKVQDVVNFIMDKIQAVVQAWNNMVSLISAPVKAVGSAIGNTASGALSEIKHLVGINDGIVQNGKVITTHPDDYIIATKTPQTLGVGKNGGGATIVLNLNYPQFRNQDDVSVVRKQLDTALRDVMRIYKLQPNA